VILIYTEQTLIPNLSQNTVQARKYLHYSGQW